MFNIRARGAVVMDQKILNGIKVESYDLREDDLVMGLMLKNYLESLSVEEAKDTLDTLFPFKTPGDDRQRASAPELISLIKKAQSVTEKETAQWKPKEADEFTRGVMYFISKMLPDSLDAEEYVKTVPYDIVAMLYDCLLALESATGIYRFR